MQGAERPAEVAVSGAEKAAKCQHGHGLGHGLGPAGAPDQSIRGSSAAVQAQLQRGHALSQGVGHLLH